MNASLFEKLQKTGRLPTPPGVVLRLLELTRSPDVSTKELTAAIAPDPALTAKILRFANSPLAGSTRAVTSLPQAVNMLGVRGLTMMALSFSILSARGAEVCKGFRGQEFNIHALGCAVAAKWLAALTRLADAQAGFVAGLLSQFGRAILATAAPEEYAVILHDARRVPEDLPELEFKRLGATYAQVGGQLLSSWGLPESLCGAITAFRDDVNPRELPALAQVLRVAEVGASVLCPTQGKESPGAADFVRAAADLDVSMDDCRKALTDIAQELQETRAVLEIPQASLRNLEDIEDEVRECLAELNFSLHAESLSAARQQQALMRLATTDPLTKVANRAAFDAQFASELERSQRTSVPFSIFMIDVDQFKSLNDTYGHQAGDRVLFAVASVLQGAIRKVDFLARYGGDEFVILAPGASGDDARRLAERLRETVQSLNILWDDHSLHVTVSIGVGIVTQVNATQTASRILARADERLYAAKQAGRNCVEVCDLGEPQPSVAPHTVEKIKSAPAGAGKA